MKRRLTALLLVLLCLPLTACQKQQNLYSATWFDLFDTVAIVQGYADSQDSWNAQTQAMYSDLQRYNELFDIYHHYDGVINLYDVNARAAQARGLTSALLNIGGNVRAIGTKPGGKPWTAGVENPWGDDPAYIQAVELADGDSLVISGDYQRYFEYDGVRYAHLIDLTTGYPARYVSSVAVLARADTGGLADALSTGLFCLPEETGQALAAQNHYAVLWMHPDETTSRSADWPQ